MSTLVKICGITQLDDALAAAEAGADWIGFNFWPKSKRYIPPAHAAVIVRALPPSVLPVGLFVNATREELEHAVKTSGVRLAQLHGDETEEQVADLTVPLLQVIRISDEAAAARAASWKNAAQVLLDASVVGYGGAGQRFEWSLIEAARRALGRNVLVAGGLTPENVGELVRAFRPEGVDVASGVETAPGRKDRARMIDFVRAVREAETR